MKADSLTQIDPQAQSSAAHEQPGAVRSFLKEYWLWIVIPFVLAIGGILALYFLMSGEEGASPFTYTIY